MSEEISFELSDENIEEHATRVKDEATRAFRRLLMLPRRGRLLFRDNDSAINWERPVNREAIIGQTRGEVTSVTCGRCQNGLGPFSKCVVVEGFFSGSCTNCHYNSQEVPPRGYAAAAAAANAAANASFSSASRNNFPKVAGAARNALQNQPPHSSDTQGTRDRGRHLSRQDMIQRGKEFLEMGRQLLDDIEEWTKAQEGVASEGQEEEEEREEGDSNEHEEPGKRDGDGRHVQGQNHEKEER
ncbi:MAG: hypothetical protein M1815_001824 [Lichina confinis]|nr:MAG: hypothetical protein M1815_001824 [Lichina confinis]